MLQRITISRDRNIEILFVLYLILKPFYLSTMLMQPADFVILGIFAICIFSKKGRFQINMETQKAYRSYCCLSLYACIVNFFWFICLERTESFMNTNRLLDSSLYLIFNGIAIYAILMSYAVLGQKIFKLFMYGAFCSVTLQTIMSVVLYNPLLNRQVVAFHNPNQLGYYAVIMLTVGIIWGEYLNIWGLLIYLFEVLYLNMLSLSKASIIASVVLLFLSIVYRYNNKGFFHRRVKVLFVAGGITGVAILILIGIIKGEIPVVGGVINRIAGLSKEWDSNLGDGRGYNRVFEMNTNMLWGLGEGAYERFIVMNSKEIHSTFISVFVCYGIIGMVIWLFSMIKFLIIRGKMGLILVVSSGIGLYWMTHNGIRNTMAWLTIALVSLYFRQDSKESADYKELEMF